MGRAGCSAVNVTATAVGTVSMPMSVRAAMGPATVGSEKLAGNVAVAVMLSSANGRLVMSAWVRAKSRVRPVMEPVSYMSISTPARAALVVARLRAPRATVAAKSYLFLWIPVPIAEEVVPRRMVRSAVIAAATA